MSPVDDEAVAVHYSGRVIFNPGGFNLCATGSTSFLLLRDIEDLVIPL